MYKILRNANFLLILISIVLEIITMIFSILIIVYISKFNPETKVLQEQSDEFKSFHILGSIISLSLVKFM